MNRPFTAIVHAVAAAAAVAFATPFAEAKTLALLVGIGNYDDPRNNLACLDADIGNMRKLATGPLGVAESDLLVVTDRKATAAGIIEAFRSHLVRKAGPDDTVVFYFSGHGYHIADQNGDEEDGQDEILVPYGIDILKEKSYITDDQMGEMLKELRCRRAVVVLDSCHSGTGTRGLNDAIKKSWKPPYDEPSVSDRKSTPFEYKPRPRNDSFQRLGSVEKPRGTETVVFTACQAEQTALGPKEGSLFTAAFCAALTANPSEDMGRLIATVAPTVARNADRLSKGHKQVPRYEGPSAVRLVGAAAVAATPAPATATPLDTTVSPVRPAVPAARPEPAATLRPLPARPVASSTLAGGEIIQHRDFAVMVQLLDARTGDNRASQNIRVGTDVVVQVKPERDCYVRLYHMDAAGKLTLVYPNLFQTNNFVRGNSTAQFPAAGDAFKFVIEEPLGMEMIKAVCSTTPFKDTVLPPEGNSPFYRLPGLHSGELSSRGLGAYSTRPAEVAPTRPAPAVRLQAENYVNYLVQK